MLAKIHKNTKFENIIYTQKINKTKIPKHSNMRQMSKNTIIEFMLMSHLGLDMGPNLKFG